MPRYASRLPPVLGLLLWPLGSAANAQHSLLSGETRPSGHIRIRAETGTLEFRAMEIAPWAPR